MASNQPPYHTSIYLESIQQQLRQVAEVTSPYSGSFLDTDLLNTAEASVQQWNLDPFNLPNNQFFVKLNSDLQQVLESPLDESSRAFINLQGDANRNGGIQVSTIPIYMLRPLQN